MRIYRALILLLACAGLAAPAPLVPVRAWQFHKLAVPYVTAALARAPEYDVNTVIYSHSMIGFAEQLFDGTDRGAKLRGLAAEAHRHKLRAWIWVRELDSVPPQFMDGKRVAMDRPGFWEWLGERYTRVFRTYPEFDGLVLTFHETPYKVFNQEEVKSELSIPERFARVMNTIDSVCHRFGKDLVVRSFFYEPREMEWFAQALSKVPPRVGIQTKCEPHDWQPFYPDDPLIGKFPGRQQIIEFDGSSEFTGKNRIPYTSPEYFERRWRYDLAQPGVAGYNVRLDHSGYDALNTPNEINIYALYRMTEDPKITAAEIWREWTAKRYGQEAAPDVEAALRPTFEAVNKALFVLGFWITNHSRVPLDNYAAGHLASRSLAKWFPGKSEYAETERRLRNPDPQVLEAVLAEKDEAVALAQQSLIALAKARPHLQPALYEDLAWRIQLLNRVAEVWRLHAEAWFGYRLLQDGKQVPGLRERVERALAGLSRQAVLSEQQNPGKAPPASAVEIRAFVADLNELLLTTEARRTRR